MFEVISGRRNLINSENETLQNELGLGLTFISCMREVQKHCVGGMGRMLAVVLSCTCGKGSWKDACSPSIDRELWCGQEHTVTPCSELPSAPLMLS